MRHNFRPKNKYNAKKTVRDGMTFDSKTEAQYYDHLKKLRDDTGSVLFFLRQVPFDLPGNVKYRVDFQIFWADGEITFEDVKGQETSMFKMKKKQVEDLYPIEITIVKKRGTKNIRWEKP